MQFSSSRWASALIVSTVIVLAITLRPQEAHASSSYVYDQVGRLTTVLYDNGVGVQFSYDAAGNQTSSNVVTCGTAPMTWGSGLWGCSTGTAQ